MYSKILLLYINILFVALVCYNKERYFLLVYSSKRLYVLVVSLTSPPLSPLIPQLTRTRSYFRHELLTDLLMRYRFLFISRKNQLTVIARV